MEVKFELDIPDEDYATLTKWLKNHVANATVENTLKYGAEMDVQKFLPRARKHLATGKNAFERFRDTIYKENKDD